MANSSTQLSAGKPPKPYDGFPLFPHANGKWAKKIRGKFHYFGRWADPYGALHEYNDQAEALHAGRTPRSRDLTVKDLCNHFLTAKNDQLRAGEIVARTFDDYRPVTDLILKTFGRNRLVEDLLPEDFSDLSRKMPKTWGPVRRCNFIQRTRTVFKFAMDAVLIQKPVQFGPGFKRPSAKTLRKSRAKNGERLFEPGELRTILEWASVPMHAMILLAINCGYGNSDCGQLTTKQVDLGRCWITFPRPKTEVKRRCPLWPETVDALKAYRAMARKPADSKDAGLFFLTERGFSWHKERATNPVSQAFKKLLKKIDRHTAEKAGKEPSEPLCRPGRSFYSLRHTFQTIAEEAGESPDFSAIEKIMGHAPHSRDMAARYRERISDERLKRVTDHVRAWLFPSEDQPTEHGEGGAA